MESTGSKFRRWREEAGRTQGYVAEKAGVAQSTVSNVERDAYPDPGAVTLKAMAAVLGHTLAEAFEETPNVSLEVTALLNGVPEPERPRLLSSLKALVMGWRLLGDTGGDAHSPQLALA